MQREYSDYNAVNVLTRVDAAINELQSLTYDDFRRDYQKSYQDSKTGRGVQRYRRVGYQDAGIRNFNLRAVCDEFSIFDWWRDYLSLSQLKQMKKFLETAIQLGFTGYVCFKVGSAGCSHGMWAHRTETTDGYSPDGDALFHSFRSGDNYWDVKLNDEWLHDQYDDHEHYKFTLKQVKAAINVQ